jgi:hypothetical protein
MPKTAAADHNQAEQVATARPCKCACHAKATKETCCGKTEHCFDCHNLHVFYGAKAAEQFCGQCKRPLTAGVCLIRECGDGFENGLQAVDEVLGVEKAGDSERICSLEHVEDLITFAAKVAAERPALIAERDLALRRIEAAHSALDKLDAPTDTTFGPITGKAVIAERIRLYADKRVAERDALRLALRNMLAEVECFCADNVAYKEPCPVHAAEAALAAGGK